MAYRCVDVYLWDDRALIMDRVEDEPQCRVFYYWLEAIGDYYSVFGNNFQRELHLVYEFPPLGAPATSDLLPLQSKESLSSRLAVLVVEMADLWVSYYRGRGDAVVYHIYRES